MKKLLLIHTKTENDMLGYGNHFFLRMPPLSLAYLGSLTPANWDIKIVDEYVDTINTNEEADLVGITAYTSNSTRAYEISNVFRNNGSKVVMGGIHVSMCQEEALNYADAIVVGEAESVWPSVISDFENNGLKTIYHGERLPLDDLPFPRRDLFSSNYTIDVIQTSRGCPFGCEFCSVTNFNGGAYRQRPVSEVLSELQTLKRDMCFFVDDNILGASDACKLRALELFKGIIKNNRKILWGSQASLNIADENNLLEYAFKSGCRVLLIGFESINENNLEQMNKRVNMNIGPESFIEKIKFIQKKGIAVLGSFMIGSDFDDYNSLKNTADFINRSGIAMFDLAYLTPYPGTKLIQKLSQEERIIYNRYPNDWKYYGSNNIVIQPKNMSILDMVHGYDYIVKECGNKRIKLNSIIKNYLNLRSISSSLLAYQLSKDIIVSLKSNY